MRPAQELLHADMILADGAMGTYFSQLSGLDTRSCEAANIESPHIIRRIHQEYINAGAGLLRTNTFAAASRYIRNNPRYVADLVRAGWQIAAECAGDSAFVAADIGPVYGLEPEISSLSLQIVIDTFINCGAKIFLFETFADPGDISPWSKIIRRQVADAVIIASFALSADGSTRKGIALDRLAASMEQDKSVDIWGINCSIGPNHMRELLRLMPAQGKPLSLMPNSGYPHLEDGRLIFGSSPDYFAQSALDLRSPRTRIIGGCCGTTPLHLASLNGRLSLPVKPLQQAKPRQPATRKPVSHHSLTAIQSAKSFICLCELDPPRNSDLSAFIQAAQVLESAGIDGITVADSPLARVKVDPVTCSARIMRETNLVSLPHLCCRDRNVNSLRSALLAAHSEGIRQILAITGDAIPESDSGFVKPVFNLNSAGLISLIAQMNEDVFAADPMLPAAALDPGVRNIDVEYRRAMKKMESGARVFLTQPIYDSSCLKLIAKVRSAGAQVLIGLMPLVSYRNARFMSQEVPGIRIPDKIIDKFTLQQTAQEAIRAGLDIAIDFAEQSREQADGFYFIAPFNRAEVIAELLARLQEKGLIC